MALGDCLRLAYHQASNSSVNQPASADLPPTNLQNQEVSRMVLLLTFTLSYVGFGSLMLAMDQHCKRVCQCVPSQKMRLILRFIGLVALFVALTASIMYLGWDTGMVLWLGLLTSAALSILIVLIYWPSSTHEL